MDVKQPQYLGPAAIDFGNTTEETVNANQTNPVPVEETEPA